MDASRVPVSGVRVRCPRCAQVFSLQSAPVAPPAAPVSPPPPPRVSAANDSVLGGFELDLREPPRPRPAPRAPAHESAPAAPAAPRPLSGGWGSQPERTLELDAPAPKPAPQRLETPPFNPLPASEPAVVASTTTAPVPTGARDRLDPAHERARRLARVLISDILVYNQPVLSRARGEGNLATALGAEIGKAWELYKSKVSSEVAASTTYFKDALNEILGEGEKIF